MSKAKKYFLIATLAAGLLAAGDYAMRQIAFSSLDCGFHRTTARHLPSGEVMLEGFDGAFETGGRDRWLLLLEPGDRAVFVY